MKLKVLVYNPEEGDFGNSVWWARVCREKNEGHKEKEGGWKWILNRRRRRLTNRWRCQKNRCRNNLRFLDPSAPDMAQAVNLSKYSQTPPSLTQSALEQQHGSSSSSSSTLLLPPSSSTSSTTSCPCPHKSSPATSATSNSLLLPSETMASKSSLMASWYCLNPNNLILFQLTNN